MKAERRHELQTNTLAQFLTDLPLYLRFHANKLLVGVIVLCAIILLVRHRMNSAIENQQLAQASILEARGGVQQLSRIDLLQPNDTARVEARKKTADQVSAAISEVLNNTSDPGDAAARAEAYLAEGDLNWTLANLPALPGAATRPSLAMPHSSGEYLDSATSAYEQVLKDYPDQKIAKATALFGLASVSENRGQWDKAKDYYDQALNDPGIAQVFKDVARQRLALLPEMRRPVYFGTFSSTQPTSAPATEPASMPVTSATEMPAAMPVSQPTIIAPSTTEPAVTQPTSGM